MRALTLFTATLAIVFGLSSGAQAVSLTVSFDKSTYLVSEIITITVVGDSMGLTAIGVAGAIQDDRSLVTPLGPPTQTTLRTPLTVKWLVGGLLIDNPGVNGTSVDMFSQLNGLTVPQGTTKKLTSVMTWHADTGGIAVFTWATKGGQQLTWFGITNGAIANVTIVPEPTTAGLMGLGILGLVIAGRRRKS